VRSLLKVHVLAVEYPGYGVYDGSPNADQIIDDAIDVYDFLTQKNEKWAIDESDIILFGRSIGSGPATHVASVRSPCSLLLMSPFMSIRDIAKEQAGYFL
jgi:acetyl esterase/lipase